MNALFANGKAGKNLARPMRFLARAFAALNLKLERHLFGRNLYLSWPHGPQTVTEKCYAFLEGEAVAESLSGRTKTGTGTADVIAIRQR